MKFSPSAPKNPLKKKMFKRFKKEIRSIVIVTMRATVVPGLGQPSPLERSEIRINKRIVLDNIEPSSLISRATRGQKPVLERVEARKNLRIVLAITELFSLTWRPTGTLGKKQARENQGIDLVTEPSFLISRAMVTLDLGKCPALERAEARKNAQED